MAVFFDYFQVKIGVKAAKTEQLLAQETPLVKVGVKAAHVGVMAAADSVQTKIGDKALDADSKGVSESVLSKSAVKAAAADSWSHLETVQAKPGLKPAQADQYREADLIRAAFGLKVANADVTAASDSPQARPGVKAGGVQTLGVTETLQAKAGVKAAITAALTAQDVPQVKLGLKAALVEGRNYSDVLRVGIGVKASNADSYTPADTLRTKIGLLPHFLTCEHFLSTLLIPALRAQAQTSLPELLAIVEALSDAPTGDDEAGNAVLRYPYLAIIAAEPEPDFDTAVFSMARWIEVDFVYLDKSPQDGATDKAQGERGRLDRLANGMVDNYHLGGVVNQMEITRTPMNRQTQYQTLLANEAQTAMIVSVLTARFRITEDTLCV